MRSSIEGIHDANRPPDSIRLNAYLEGQRWMRDQIANDLSYVADSAPSQDAADHIWRYIMALKGTMIS